MSTAFARSTPSAGVIGMRPDGPKARDRLHDRRHGPALPAPVGPLSAFIIEHLARRPRHLPLAPAIDGIDPLIDDDLHLALYCTYELHYRGFAGVDDGWEWEPSLLRFRSRLEECFVAALEAECGRDDVRPSQVAAELKRIIASGGGPSLSRHMAEVGTREQFREFCIHRSAYQLKEADPHTWAIPRLSGVSKAAMITIQADEYGQGRLEDMHATLFARTMEALGLSDEYGAYLDLLPGVTLATCNLVTMFGLHRRWRGALVGHLALFEMTSVLPMGRYAAALDRLGIASEARQFYDVHVIADAEHQVIGARDLAGGLARSEPWLAGDICFGARALMAVEGRLTAIMLDSWQAGVSSLRIAGARPAGPRTGRLSRSR